MVTNKIVLSDFDIEIFYLCAIHANIPSYKMAFLLNKHLGLQLKRAKKDVTVTNTEQQQEIYPKYVFDDETHYITYTLVKNKCVLNDIDVSKGINLFTLDESIQETKKLISEYKNADYFLKIESENDTYAMKMLVSEILEIKQVITSYEVDYNKIKKKTNLIFE